MYKAPDPLFPPCNLLTKTIHLMFGGGGNLITANTLTLFAVMNRVSHACGFWFIFLTFCMQRRHVLYNHNVTRQKKRSGLWENKPPAFPLMSLLFCLTVAAFILLSTESFSSKLKFSTWNNKTRRLHVKLFSLIWLNNKNKKILNFKKQKRAFYFEIFSLIS